MRKKKTIRFWEEKIKRGAGGRNKNPKVQHVKLLYGEPKSPLYKPKVKPEVKPSGRTYIKFIRKK